MSVDKINFSDMDASNTGSDPEITPERTFIVKDVEIQPENEEPESQYRTTPYRWAVAFCIFVLILNAIMATPIFAAVNTEMSVALGIPFFWI